MSLRVRQRDNGVCFTCGVKKPIEEMNAGHFIHKNCLDFNKMNINCQCVKCNQYLSGNLGIYAIKLIEKYGKEQVDNLIFDGQKTHKFTLGELETIYEELSRN